MDVHINTKATYVNPFDFCFYDFVNILNVLQTLFLAFAFFLLHSMCLDELRFFCRRRARISTVLSFCWYTFFLMLYMDLRP